MEVQQVGFDSEGVGAEGGAVSDVGDGVECFSGSTCADGQSSNVDTVCGEQFGIRGQGDCGDGVARAVAAAGGWCARDREGPFQQRSHAVDVAVCNKLADGARRDCVAADGPRPVNANGEAKLTAESFEAFNACLGLIAEAKIFTFVQLGYVQDSLEHVC